MEREVFLRPLEQGNIKVSRRDFLKLLGVGAYSFVGVDRLLKRHRDFLVLKQQGLLQEPLHEAEQQIKLARIIRHGNPNRRWVALTIDDGWNSYWVEQALKVCADKGVKITVFPAGSVIDANPSLWKQFVDAGHEFGCHTYHHYWLTNLTDQQVIEEVERWKEAASRIGVDVDNLRWIRPPGMAGFTTPEGDWRLRRILGELGLAVVLWSVDSNSTRLYGQIDARGVYLIVIRYAGPGAIVLQHFLPTDITALPDIIDFFRARGYEIVTLSQMFPEEQTRPIVVSSQESTDETINQKDDFGRKARILLEILRGIGVRLF